MTINDDDVYLSDAFINKNFGSFKFNENSKIECLIRFVAEFGFTFFLNLFIGFFSQNFANTQHTQKKMYFRKKI